MTAVTCPIGPLAAPVFPPKGVPKIAQGGSPGNQDPSILSSAPTGRRSRGLDDPPIARGALCPSRLQHQEPRTLADRRSVSATLPVPRWHPPGTKVCATGSRRDAGPSSRVGIAEQRDGGRTSDPRH